MSLSGDQASEMTKRKMKLTRKITQISAIEQGADRRIPSRLLQSLAGHVLASGKLHKSRGELLDLSRSQLRQPIGKLGLNLQWSDGVW